MTNLRWRKSLYRIRKKMIKRKKERRMPIKEKMEAKNDRVD